MAKKYPLLLHSDEEPAVCTKNQPTKRPSLPELRNQERSVIMKKLKDYAELLVHFDTIMAKSVQGKQYPEFVELRTVSDFMDGFVINSGHCSSPHMLHAFLRSHRLDCFWPRAAKWPGYFFLQ